MSNKLAKRATGTGPVSYVVYGTKDSPTALMLQINYEEAPVPEHYYVADWFDLVVRDLDVVLSFGSLDRVTKRLRSRIDIVFSAYAFVNQLWRSSREFHSSLTKFVSDLKLEPSSTIAAELASDKLQTLVSNNILMVWSGTECLLDFFYISPKDLWTRPKRGEQLDLEAVVRVLAPPTLVLGLLNASDVAAGHIRERFPEYIRKGEPENANLEPVYAR